MQAVRGARVDRPRREEAVGDRLSAEVAYPMTNESGDVHLVFNGEIYEDGVLRLELPAGSRAGASSARPSSD
jgi:asparagine synthetase B (glutamine-hydrolysing)